jgi:hypothetical protein
MNKNMIGMLIAGVLLTTILLVMPSLANEPKKKGYSTLPGFSAGYRFYLDMDEDEKSKLRLFGKYKQKNGNSIKIGWDKQTGRDLNSWNADDDGVIFFEQEFKF